MRLLWNVSQTKEFLSSSLARGESAYVMKGGYANANELKGGKMEVWSGGKAENIFIGNDGYNSSWVDVSSGGTMTSARVSGGFLNLEGGFAGDTIIGNGGEMQISGGSASGIQVETSGMLIISSGTATDVEWTPFVGRLDVRDGGRVTFKTALTGIYAGNDDMALPILALGGRPLHASEERDGWASIETYQTSERLTYSAPTLRALLAEIERLEAEGRDFVYMVQENTVTGQGFPDMAAAEKAMAEQLLKEMNIEIGGGGCCCCGPDE